MKDYGSQLPSSCLHKTERETQGNLTGIISWADPKSYSATHTLRTNPFNFSFYLKKMKRNTKLLLWK